MEFSEKRRGRPSICLPLGQNSELVVLKATDKRFCLMICGQRFDVPGDGTKATNGYAVEVGLDQLTDIIVGLMKVQRMMVMEDE